MKRPVCIDALVCHAPQSIAGRSPQSGSSSPGDRCPGSLGTGKRPGVRYLACPRLVDRALAFPKLPIGEHDNTEFSATAPNRTWSSDIGRLLGPRERTTAAYSSAADRTRSTSRRPPAGGCLCPLAAAGPNQALGAASRVPAAACSRFTSRRASSIAPTTPARWPSLGSTRKLAVEPRWARSAR